jgi:hypothetical protein
MNYLERYQNGEYEQVWKELQDLGEAVREEPTYSQAKEVAAETMRRVRWHVSRWYAPVVFRQASHPAVKTDAGR